MNIRSKNIALLFSCVLLSISCVDKYLPDSLDAFDRDVNFTTKLYRPQLGKNSLTALLPAPPTPITIILALVSVSANP